MTKQDLINEIIKQRDSGKISNFRSKVLIQTLQIPKGKVSTYALLARAIDCNSSQAVGQALKHNPWAPKVPCHRIIKSDFSIGGFHGHLNGEFIDKKIKLLKSEGVEINTHSKLSDLNQIYNFD